MSALLITGLTDPGRIREQNEDCIVMTPEAGLVVVADGMGGHRAGEVASRLAVEAIQRHVVNTLADSGAASGGSIEVALVRDAIQQANQAIYAHASVNPENAGMGSMTSYQHPDGTLIRYKPGGDEYMRPPSPMFSIEVVSALTGDAVFKIDPNGNAVPWGPTDIVNPPTFSFWI